MRQRKRFSRAVMLLLSRPFLAFTVWVHLKRGQFRVHGAVMEVNPVNEEVVYRIEMNENRIAHILAIDPVTRKVRGDKEEAWIFPAKHFVTLEPARQAAEKAIMRELEEQLAH